VGSVDATGQTLGDSRSSRKFGVLQGTLSLHERVDIDVSAFAASITST
jgi:hypothetical protein